MVNNIVFIDSEIHTETKKVMDLGAIKLNQETFHSPVMRNFKEFVLDCNYICGHNIINHDLKYLDISNKTIIDTLFISPLLFPKKPYHKLLKDDKILIDEYLFS